MSVRALVRWCLAAAALAAGGVAHADGMDLLSRDTIGAVGDARLVAVDGEPSWLAGGFGKARFGGRTGDGSERIRPELAEGALIWQPRLSWSLGGTVVATAQAGQEHAIALSEAFFTYKPRASSGGARMQLRAGLFWPPISLEHSGAEWAVTDTITPSAINSWVGEEIKVAGVEASGTLPVGASLVTLTAAAFGVNDTAGALLAFRGWALHDEKAVAFGKQPLPPLNGFLIYAQPEYTHPLIDIDHRVGFYLKAAWAPPAPVRIEVLHYDNRGRPEAYDAALEWGWHTRFDDLGLTALPAAHLTLRAQAMAGRTEMGFPMPTRAWIDMRFRSAYLMATRAIDRGSVSARVEAFGTRNRGSALTSADDEDGWAATIAARRAIGAHATLLGELLHIDSRKDARLRAGLAPRQTQTQLQLALRLKL